MKTAGKETAAAVIAPGRGTSSRARGRGRGGGGRGRGGGGSTPAAARGSGGRGRGGAVSGGRGGNHGRHPRQHARPSSTNKHQGGRGRGGNGRPRSSSYSDKSRSDGALPRKCGPYAHLFCSERHSFALSRVLYPTNDNRFLLPSNHQEEPSRNQHRIASDEQMEEWWQAVKIVKCRVPYAENADTLERCPVCLDDEMVSPHIAPCGHAFCLPCALGYLGSVARELNDESDRTRKNRQSAGGGGVVGGNVSSHRASVTTIRARCPICSSGSSTVLNAGDSMITYADLRPVVFIPTLAIRAKSPGDEWSGGKGKKRSGGSPLSGTRMRFVKLHRARRCPAPYLPVRGHRARGGASAAASPAMNNLPDLPDGDDDAEECTYARQYFVGVGEYEGVLRRNLDDLNNYRNNTMYCKLDPKEDFNVSMAIKAVQAARGRWIGSGDDGGFRRMELEGREAAAISQRMGRLLVADVADENDSARAPTNDRKKSAALLQPGSFYLDRGLESGSCQGETEEFLYYQASDGQTCFLTGINVACLMHEFSLHESTSPDDAADFGETKETRDLHEENVSASDSPLDQAKATSKSRNTLPLPDELTGTVVEVEELTVTSSLIKRKPFLSHMPLNSSVSFAEIDWYSGGAAGNRPMLSHATLDKFRSELQRRKANRMRAAKREAKADRAARARSERDEQRWRRELLGRNYSDGASHRQTIDPDDEFFRAPSASFDESEEAARWNRSETFRFNEVCESGGVWPELAPSMMSPGQREAVVPSTSPAASSVANSSPGSINNTWQGRAHSAPEPKAVVNSFPSLAESLLNRKE